jgi:PIN domain nuclease of toxin-antitoxin system
LNIILDTHIWVWLALGEEKLGSRLKSVLLKDNTTLWLSPISVWEVSMLCRKGRLKLNIAASKWIETSIEKLSLKEARFTFKVGVLADKLEWANKDPADRIIVATAIEHGYKLATEDSSIHEFGGVELA